MKYFSLYLLFSLSIIVTNAKPNIHLGCTLGDPIPHPSDCSKFLICGKLDYESECDWPLLYNDKTKSCDLPQNVDCEPLNLVHKSAEKQISRLPFYADAFDTSDSVSCSWGALVPHPNDCSLFIKCGPTDLENIILRCTNSTLFNPQTSRCEMADKVTCKTYNFLVRPINNNYTTKATPTEYLYCRPSCFFPHPTDCNKFILCGKTLKENRIFTCPTSMLYNPYVQTCDIAQNVVCKIYNYEFIDDQANSTATTTLPTTTISITTNEFLNSTNSSTTINMTTVESLNLTTTTQLINVTTLPINTTTLEFSNSTQFMNTTTALIDTNSTISINETQTTTEFLNTTISMITNPEANATNTSDTTTTPVTEAILTTLSSENSTTTVVTTIETTLTTETTNLTVNATETPLNTTQLTNSTILLNTTTTTSETTAGVEQFVTVSRETTIETTIQINDVTNEITGVETTISENEVQLNNELSTTLPANNETTIATSIEF